MAGILNNKERMIDFVITEFGKEMIVQGRLRPVFASLTDHHTFYQASSSLEPNIAEDASNRIFFEATNKHQDTIVPQILPGRVMNAFAADDFIVQGSIMAEGTFRTGSVQVVGGEHYGKNLIDNAPRVYKTLADHFRDHKMLSTKDEFSDTTDFKLIAHTASFVLADNPPDAGYAPGQNLDFVYSTTKDLDQMPHFAADWRFSHLPNFMYLPPVNAKPRPVPGTNETMLEPLGNYPDVSANLPMSKNAGPGSQTVQYSANSKFEGGLAISWDQIQENVLGPAQNVTLEFSDTSMENNLLVQVFEINNPSTGGFEKLSAIDLGVYYDDSPFEDLGFQAVYSQANLYTEFVNPTSPYKQVFAVGRVEENSNGSSTFVGLFYLVFD